MQPQIEIAQRLVDALLSKRKRRYLFLLSWALPTTHDELYSFLKTILYEKVALKLTQDTLYLFNDRKLPIPYAWLTKSELNAIFFMFHERTTLFKRIMFYHGGQFDMGTLYLHWAWQHRRELVRDFCYYCTKRGVFVWSLIRAIQQLALEHPEDGFLEQIHYTLQQNDAALILNTLVLTH